jgi:hypothetical protein
MRLQELQRAARSLNVNFSTLQPYVDKRQAGQPMKTLLTIFGAIALFFIMGGIWVYTAIDQATLRYRLTYEVETPAGLKTGSGVIQVKYEDTTALPIPNTGLGNTITGEAVTVDLGGGRYLFSLIGGANEIVYRAFPEGEKATETLIDLVRLLNRDKPTVSLPFDQAPRLVTFTDINNPKTVKLADPANLAATFGAGVKLKRITVEITDDAVTEGEVEKVLGWLDDYYDKRLDGNAIETIDSTNRLANSLASGNFDTVRN